MLHTISVMYSWTRSSSKSTDSEYGFCSSPNPYIIHLTELFNKDQNKKLTSNTQTKSHYLKTPTLLVNRHGLM